MFEQWAIVIAFQFAIAIVVSSAFSNLVYRKRNTELTKRESALKDAEQTAESVTGSGVVVTDSDTPVFIGRLSPQDFIKKIQDSEAWSVRTGYSIETKNKEFELVISSENGEKEYFLGPDPIDTNIWIYRDFIEALTEITGVYSPIINFTVNRMEESG